MILQTPLPKLLFDMDIYYSDIFFLENVKHNASTDTGSIHIPNGSQRLIRNNQSFLSDFKIQVEFVLQVGKFSIFFLFLTDLFLIYCFNVASYFTHFNLCYLDLFFKSFFKCNSTILIIFLVASYTNFYWELKNNRMPEDVNSKCLKAPFKFHK